MTCSAPGPEYSQGPHEDRQVRWSRAGGWLKSSHDLNKEIDQGVEGVDTGGSQGQRITRIGRQRHPHRKAKKQESWVLGSYAPTLICLLPMEAQFPSGFLRRWEGWRTGTPCLLIRLSSGKCQEVCVCVCYIWTEFEGLPRLRVFGFNPHSEVLRGWKLNLTLGFRGRASGERSGLIRSLE